MYLRIVLVLLLLAGLVARAQNPSAPPLPPDVDAVMEGLRLSEDQASAVEKTIASSPDDLNAHLKLIGYYGGCGPHPCPSNTADKWAKHVFWMIDHHPENATLGFPLLPPVDLFFGNRGWLPTAEVINDYRKHWEQAVTAHPSDSAVLFHAGKALSAIDSYLGLPLAKKAVEIDPGCRHALWEINRDNASCRQILGGMYGLAMLRIGVGKDGRSTCLQTPEAEQQAASLRREAESVTDPEILVSAGLAMKGHSGFYHERCGGEAEEAVQFGMKLVRKGVALDPSLIDSMKLRDILAANTLANTGSGRIQNIAPEEMWRRVTQCLFPAYPEIAFNSHIAGTVDIGLGISPAGDVGKYRVLRSDHPLLIQPALDAIRQWKFHPNVVQGEVTWSRIRALVRFNADGMTAIDLAHAILADNFGDPGTPASAGAGSAISTSMAVPRPESAPACNVSVSQQVSQGLLLHKVQPTYPDDARRNHIQGTVVLHAVIDKSGRISNLKAISGPKELAAAAIGAVEQWRYRPYLLQGEPVEVQTEITVDFQLQ